VPLANPTFPLHSPLRGVPTLRCSFLVALSLIVAPLLYADDEKPRGLVVTFTTKDGSDTRVARLVSLYVAEGEAPTPFLVPGPFQAVWRGDLEQELGSEVVFTAEGRGTLKVVVNGAVALESKGDDFRKTTAKAVTLKKGANKLEVTYDSPAKGDAQVRLFWQSDEFRREPLLWNVLFHEGKHEALTQAKTLREGRELLATHRCLKCHTADTEAWVKAGGMPELALDAPSLTEVGTRLQRDWMARWIQDPHALRPTATMPRLFPDAARGLDGKLDDRARDIAAYLASLGKRSGELGSAKDVEGGTRLFVHLGCISCHTPPNKEEYEKDEKGRIPLRDVRSKWHTAPLESFLRKPDQHYAWVRMPNFNLSEGDTNKLVQYLFSVEPRKLAEGDWDKADVKKGKALVQETGCLNCHALTDDKPLITSLKTKTFADLTKDSWTKGCVAEKPGKAPIFGFNETQIKALVGFASDTRGSLKRDNPVEFAGRQIQALRCLSCHRRDDTKDLWSELKDDAEGLLANYPPPDPEKEPMQYKADQVRPTLTWTGEKLKPEWTAALLAGKLKYKPRPYLRARMPAFTQRADLLARGLSLEHGCPPQSPPDPKPDQKVQLIGENLTSKERWGCVSCHDVGKTEAVGVFESPGPNFMYIKERLRREYYDRWLWAPTRVEPDTKMPSVYMHKEKSLLKDVLDGDPDKQIDAMWQYLLQGESIKPSEK